MAIEQCYQSLPDRIFVSPKDSSGCLDIMDYGAWDAVIPCTIIRKDRTSLLVVAPLLVSPALAVMRHVTVHGKRMTIPREGILADVETLGAMSLITISLSKG